MIRNNSEQIIFERFRVNLEDMGINRKGRFIMSTITPEQIEREKLYREMGLTDEEYSFVKKMLNRLPNYTETGIFSVMWSEHCSYKTSKPLLKKFPTKAPYVLQGPGEGAGVIDIGNNKAVVFINKLSGEQ